MRAWVLASLLVLFAGATGCGDDPVSPGPPAPFQYLPPISPQGVLQNLVSAYVRRDSVETANVYDATYVGTSVDLSLPTPIPDFSKADEIRHVGRLKRDPNILSVSLDLGAPGSWQVQDAGPSYPPGWKTIQITNQTIRIEDAAMATTWQSQNRIIEYTFKPTDAGPGIPAESDTTWTVVRWTEFAN